MLDGLALLAPWCGAWEGVGRGYFPTIRSFSYRERLTLVADADRGMVRVEVTAWKTVDGASREEASHHEVGAIVWTGDGLEMSTIQNGTRYERLVGTPFVEGPGLRIEWGRARFANDQRMIATARAWHFDGTVLRYTMAMQTTAVGNLEPHLEAELRRRDGA